MKKSIELEENLYINHGFTLIELAIVIVLLAC